MKRILIIVVFIAVPVIHAIAGIKNFDGDNFLRTNNINAICQDLEGFIWLATEDGLVRYDGLPVNETDYPVLPETEPLSRNVRDIHPHESGLWTACDNGLFLYDFASASFLPCMYIDGTRTTRISEPISSVIEVTDGSICALGVHSARLYISDSGRTFRIPDLTDSFISISPFRDNMFLALGHGGLYIISSAGEVVTHYGFESHWIRGTELRYNPEDGVLYVAYGLGFKGTALEIDGLSVELSQRYVPENLLNVAFLKQKTVFSIDGGGLEFVSHGHVRKMNSYTSDLPGDVVKSMMVDRNNNLWLGIYRRGISVYSDKFDSPEYLSPSNSSLGYDIVTAISPDSRYAGYDRGGVKPDMVYLGYDGGGLGIMDLRSGESRVFNTSNSGIPGDNVLSISQDGDCLYLGIYTKGLVRFSLTDHTFETVRMSEQDFHNHVWTIHDDGRGRIWVGSASLFVYEKSTGKIREIPELSYSNCRSICHHGDTLWVGTAYKGLFRIDMNTLKVFDTFSFASRNPFPAGNINYLYRDGHGKLWLSTSDGFYSLDSSGNLKRYGEENGLRDDNVSSIAEDSSGILWMAAGRYIFRYNAETDSFLRYDVPQADVGTFTYNSGVSGHGRIFFGSTSGLVIFDPERLHYEQDFDKVYCFSLESLSGKGRHVYPLYGSRSSSVRIPYDQNTFAVTVAVPELLWSGSVGMSYMMDGLPDSQWHNVPDNSKILFTGLQSGNYTLRLRYTDSNGAWRESDSLMIAVSPPWYRSVWAIAVWIVLSLGVLAAFAILYIRELYSRHRAQIAEIEKDTERRLNDAKFNFYTNMTHELGTPTFLIAAQLEDLLTSRNKIIQVPVSYVSSMYRSALKLSNLISRVMDFRKYSPEEMRMRSTRSDVVAFCRRFVPDYESLCARKSISFVFRPAEESIMLDYDPDKIEMILSNLVSNAFKYTGEGGYVLLQVTDAPDRVVFSVKDNGIGIVESMRDRIFETFVRTDRAKGASGGDGMGLSFTRSLVEMHGGKISVESEVNKGSCFTFWIPKTEAEEGCSAEVIASECNDIRQKTVPVNSTSPYTVLVIDDEEEICNLLERHLMEEYRVYKASDGKEGLAVAEEVVPDVVICDLMMPVMDGHAFLTALRKNPKLNSCKVIILTAKGSADDYVQVIDEKADLYLPKTVSLKAIDKYIYDFVGGVEHETAGIGKTQDRHPLTRNEKAFLKECRQVIKDNIDNPDFNAEFLAGKLSLSHSSLYKKIRTLTGMSLIEFINDYKISVAVNLFNRGETNVETVCLKCGFRDVKNFRNLFRRKTGLLPKQYVDSLR